MFNNIGLGGLVLISLVVLILFGRGRVGSLISEVGYGVSGFRRGLKESRDPKEPGSVVSTHEAGRQDTAK